MRKSFYSRFALNNLIKNRRIYFPYFLASVFTIIMFYNMCFLTFNPGTTHQNVSTILSLGIIIIAIFSVIILFYSNSFVIKRRKKEFGIINILGMDKKQIAFVLFLETIFFSILSIASGLALGILFSKLSTLLLQKILHFNVSYGFTVSYKAVFDTVLLFLMIFLLTLLFNLAQIRLSKPVELLRGSNVGEKEPKTKWIMALLGVISLGSGYYISLTTKKPLEAMNIFFIAVILVIIGTYFIFIAGSIALLKTLRKNKRYYYKTNHFTAVSGMIYRMKQNAAGLASICILSTMVLVVVSTTLSLYVGVEDVLSNRYPTDIIIGYSYKDKNNAPCSEILESTKEAVKNDGRTISNLKSYNYFSFVASKNSNDIEPTNKNTLSLDNASYIIVMTESGYNNLTGKDLALSDDGIAYFSEKNLEGTVTLAGKDYKVQQRLETKPFTTEYGSSISMDTYFIIVQNDSAFDDIFDASNAAYKNTYAYKITFDLDGTDEQKIDSLKAISTAIGKINPDGKISIDSKQTAKTDFYDLYGSLFFLGIFLGMLFLMATVLIIFYKQISEGYDDAQRFLIMQKVGMSKKEVKQSINSQVLTVFFIPIVMAVIHIAFAFPIITKLLKVLYLTNVPLFALCTAASVLVFAAIYMLVYYLTSKEYYRIVSAAK